MEVFTTEQGIYAFVEEKNFFLLGFSSLPFRSHTDLGMTAIHQPT